MTCGRGFPDAEHFRDVDDPGWTACSEKAYVNTGASSDQRRVKIRLYVKKITWKFLWHFIFMYKNG